MAQWLVRAEALLPLKLNLGGFILFVIMLLVTGLIQKVEEKQTRNRIVDFFYWIVTVVGL